MADLASIVADVRAEEEERAATSNLIAADGSPDEALANQRRQQASGVPAGVLPATPQLRAAIDRQREIDRLSVSPRLRAYLADPTNAAVAHDDVRSLSAMERWGASVFTLSPLAMGPPAIMAAQTGLAHWSAQGVARWLRDPGVLREQYEQGERQIEIARLSNRDNPETIRAYDDPGALTPAERRRLDRLTSMPAVQARNPADMVAQQFPQILGAFDASGRRAFRDAASVRQQAYGDEPPPISVESAVTGLVTAPAAAAAFAGGAVRGFTGFAYEQEAGHAFQEYRNFVDDEGNRIPIEIAGRYARHVGEINAGIEFLGLGGALKAAGVDELFGRLTGAGVREAIRRIGYRRAAADFGARVGGAAAVGGPTEASQESVTIALGMLAQDEAGGRFERATPAQIAERVWEAFAVGATVGGVLGSVPAGATLAFDVADVQRVREQEAAFNALSEIAGGSKLKGRSASRYASAVDALTQGGALAEFRIDAQRFQAFFQDADQDPMAVADALRGVGRDALARAIETGGELTIPAGTYASQIVGTPADAGLREHMRIGPGAMTPAEVKARMELGVDLQRASSEAARLYGEAQALASENQEVFDRILEMLEGADAYVSSANRTAATLLTANLAQWAARTGTPLRQFLGSIGLDIRGPFEAQRTGAATLGVLGRLDALDPSIPRNAVPRARVRVARPKGDGGGIKVEAPTEEGVIKTSWGNLAYRPGVDLIASRVDDAADKYPIKKAIFDASYAPVEGQDGVFAKRADVPVGWFELDADTLIATAEGPTEAKAGDVVLIGAAGEMWPMSRAKFDQRYEAFDDPPQLDAPLDGGSAPDFHPGVFKIGTREEAQALLALINNGGTFEEIMASPLFARLDDLVAAVEPTMTAADKGNPDYWMSRRYVTPNGEANLADAMEYLRGVYESAAGESLKREKRLVLVAGHMGAGKSSTIRAITAEIGAAFIDADKAKALSPLYDDGAGAQIVHAETAHIRTMLLEEMLGDGVNMVLETVGHDPVGLRKTIADARAAGYRVDYVLVDVSADEAARRMARRYLLEEGRAANPASVRAHANKPRPNYEGLLADKLADGYVRIDAEGPIGTAQIAHAQGADDLAGAIGNGLGSARSAADGAGNEGGDAPGARNATRGESELFQEGETLGQTSGPKTGPRGSISFAYNLAGRVEQAIINLFEARNLSTVFHEVGHLNLELLMTLGLEADAPAGLATDARAVLDWFGVTPEQWDGLTFEQRRPYHEQFAHGFEAYLYEGKAPSVALRGVFQVIKNWLVAIYRRIDEIGRLLTDRTGRTLELNDEVRNVMDRLLASDDAIAEARKAQGAIVMSREQFKGTDKQYARYLASIDRARADAEADLRSSVMEALFADRTRWWRSEERKTREGVTLDVDQEPARIAYDWLVSGRWREEANGPKPEDFDQVRLALASVLEDYGQAAVDALPATLTKTNAEELANLAMTARRELKKRAPIRLANAVRAYAQRMGGIKDNNGELANVLKDAKGWGRVVNEESATGLDDLVMAMWERGYFGPPPQRVTGAAFEQFVGTGGNQTPEQWEALSQAEDMEAAGADPNEIWRTTRWGRGLDGAWMRWLDDADLIYKIDLEAAILSKARFRLDELIEWPSLWAWREDMREVEVQFYDGPTNEGGAYIHNGGMVPSVIMVNRKQAVQLGKYGTAPNQTELTLRATLRHEMQHAVQNRNPGEPGSGEPGMARGANPGAMTKASPHYQRLLDIALTNEKKNGELTMAATERAIQTVRYYIYRHEIGEIYAEEVVYRAMLAKAKALSGFADRQHPSDIRQPNINVQHAWRATTLFQDGERPSINEFLDRLAADLGRDPVYSHLDLEDVDARQQYEDWREWFAERGVDIMKDDRATIIAAMKKLAVTEDQDGLHPDTLASIFDGFAANENVKLGSGEALLKALSGMKPRHEEIRERTRARMIEKYGDPFADGSIAEEARLAAHREARARTIELELEAISRATGGGSRPVSAAAKEIAERQIDHMTVKQIRGYAWFEGNERREAKHALEALARGDAQAARDHKYRQLINFHLYRLARKAAEEMDVAQRYLKKFDRPGVRENIDRDYLVQIDGLLEQFELKNITGREIERRMSLAEWSTDMENRGLGHLVNVDPRRLRDAVKRPFARLPLEEARGLVDTVKNIEHLGRLKDKLLAEKERREFRATVGEVVAAMEATGPISKAVRTNYQPNAIERAQDFLRKVHAEMTRMEFLFLHLDGQTNGAVWNALWAPFARAADKETALMREATLGMQAIWSRYNSRETARLFNKRIAVPELAVKGPGENATSYTKIEIIAMALNWGNEGNRKALLDGFGWDEATVQAVLDRTLDARDWESVQMIWDLIGTFRDEAFQLQEDLTGVRPQAVEAMPVQTPHGVLRGGYYPLKYDGQRNVRQDRDDKRQEALENWGSNWAKPMTRKGHLEARVGSGGRPVKLSIAVFTDHVNNVAHDIAYRRAVIDVTRIVEDEQFANSFIGVAGKPMYDQLRPWLQSIASDRADPSAWPWQFMQKLRGNVAIAAMGWRISTGLQQLTGVIQAIPELGSVEMGAALLKLTRNPATIAEKAQVILGKSEFMRSRRQTLDRDIRETIERMERTDALYKIRHNAFALVGMFDWAVSSTVWTAAYDKAMGGHVNGIDPGDEAAAISYGDSVVRRTQSAGLNQDLPNIMRGRQETKLLTMFFSYFSVLYNWTANEVMATRKGRVPLPVFVANLALVYVISPFLAEALAGRLTQREDESEEERNDRIMWTLIRYPAAVIPVVRGLMDAAVTGFDFTLSPAEGGLNTIVRASRDALQGRTFESESTAKAAVNALGYSFGLPTGQAWVTIDYLVDQIEGEEEGFDPVEAFVADRR